MGLFFLRKRSFGGKTQKIPMEAVTLQCSRLDLICCCLFIPKAAWVSGIHSVGFPLCQHPEPAVPSPISSPQPFHPTSSREKWLETISSPRLLLGLKLQVRNFLKWDKVGLQGLFWHGGASLVVFWPEGTSLCLAKAVVVLPVPVEVRSQARKGKYSGVWPWLQG